MKKRIPVLAIVLFMFTAKSNAQEVAKKDSKKATTEAMSADTKSEDVSVKKECTKPKKGGCCAHKKAEETKSI